MKYRIPRNAVRLSTSAFALILGLAVLAPSFGVTAQTDDVRKLLKQSRRLARAEDLPAAEKLLRRAVEIAPTMTEANVDLAFVLAKRRKLVEAYKIIFAICQAEPRNARALSVLGTVLLYAGHFKEVRPVLYTALKIDRGQDLAWAGLGLLEFYENNIEESLQCLAEAKFRKIDEPDYWFSYAQVAARSERYLDAADAYNEFLNVSSSTDSERRDRIKGLVQFLRFIGLKGRLYNSIGQEQTTVNFELVGNRPVITLRVNKNTDPLRFVLDTGSGITVISEDTAKRLKIKSINHGGFAKGLGGDGRFEIVYGFLQTLTVGDVSIRDVPVYIRKFHAEQSDVDGYIGLAVISKFLTTIDYGAKTFSLQKRDGQPALEQTTDLSLPLRLTSSGFLSGQVQIEGIESALNFIVDTGASMSVISKRVAANDAISPLVNDEPMRVIGSAGVTEGVQTFMLPRVTFGPHSRRQITAIALDLDLINEATGFEQAGILGGNFLKNYRMTFDFRNSKVNFTAVTPEN